LSAAAKVQRNNGIAILLVEVNVGDAGRRLEIAEADDQGVQAALQNAYENNLLRGRKLLAAKRLVEIRRQRGKSLKINPGAKPRPMSSEALVRAYQEDTNRKRILIRRAETARGRLLFVVEAMRRLIADELFQRLLAEEGLVTLPEPLAARIARTEATNS